MFLRAASGDEGGFTLIEFVVATLILSVGVLGLLKMVALSVSMNVTNKMRTSAVQIADQVLVKERATKGFSQYTSTNPSSPALVIPAFRGAGFSNYSVTESVSRYGTGGKQVRVIVTWHYKNKSYQHNLSTVVADDGK
ncbi:hypothetical protein GMST_03770 [Geomonas silvestris]|uniref:Prepilin-type N-terminal cleavage/methylation domain-containing protein n=1 Tax=Geomonas silvestris TaxID=2740184 RepID=A0A6V8MDP1_9BACT|nr:prepilin-type N-terminal cleavage/methylation domain-containing protein [Geomonas silvestris]GFO58052.1 hypothetical protein GMST_03770 [Geomonas silvestris]